MQNEQQKSYQEKRIEHWDSVASQPCPNNLGGYYHKRLREIYQFLVPSGQRILELGCGKGDLLASLSPSYGVGIDFSEQMLNSAKNNYPELTFIKDDAISFTVPETFDFIIISDLFNDVWDVQSILEHLKANCHTQT